MFDGNDTTFQIYHYNDEANLTALPSANFQFVGVDSSNNTISATNHTYLSSVVYLIDGHFSEKSLRSNKSFQTNNNKGSISGLPNGRLYFGESIELTANPVEHFQFLYWSDSSSETNPVRIFNIPDTVQSSPIKAVYSAIEYERNLFQQPSKRKYNR